MKEYRIEFINYLNDIEVLTYGGQNYKGKLRGAKSLATSVYKYRKDNVANMSNCAHPRSEDRRTGKEWADSILCIQIWELWFDKDNEDCCKATLVATRYKTKKGNFKKWNTLEVVGLRGCGLVDCVIR